MSIAIASAQLDFTVGDIAGNVAKMAATRAKAGSEKAALVVFPEMSLTGYPAEDLVLRRSFQDEAMRAVEQLALLTADGGAAIILGGLWRGDGALYNTVFLLDGGRIAHRQYKHILPNYGVFDEKRVFSAGPAPSPVCWRDLSLGLMICEDMWGAETARVLKKEGAELLVVINSSPYEARKEEMRHDAALSRVRETGLPLMYVNLVGGQDELVFDGGSFVMLGNGIIQSRMHHFSEDFAITRWERSSHGLACAGGRVETARGREESIYSALTLGLRDYVEKNRFPGVLLGLSGGIDSALTAAVAADALGKERVHAVMLPSPYTSEESVEDAKASARALGMRLDTVPVSQAMLAMGDALAPLFTGRPPDVTEENIQSRLRGALLMAISNKFGSLLLTTGNKSELAAGYATLYGDMCGGFNVLKDVYKTEVYRLARWRNGGGEVIPGRVLTKAPSAELKPNQTDQDSLPPYDVLDAILERLIERQMPLDVIERQGYDRATIDRVAQLLYRSEYKRRQAAPGVKISEMSFGRDRRYPLTCGWVA